MRIGQFAKDNNVTIDTVRHYIDLKLLLPAKLQGQYRFDEQCQQNMNEIMILKDMGFKLNEIKKIAMFKLLGNMTSYQKDEYYRMIFEQKHSDVSNEISDLERVKKSLETKLDKLSQLKSEKKYSLGVSFNAISKLRCLKCKSKLNIKNGEIVDDQIIDGTLACKCGETYEIKNGIVMIEQTTNKEKIEYKNDIVTDYITTMDSNYLTEIYRSLDWSIKTIQGVELESKTILDLGSGFGFMLRNLYNSLPDDCLYIAVDYNIEMTYFLKNMLEMSDVKKDILFIHADFKELPIADRSIDVIADYAGTTSYNFTNKEFLLAEIDHYINPKATLIGTFVLFDNFAKDSLIEQQFRENYILNNIKKKISALEYEKQNENCSATLDKSGIYDDYFVNGERVFVFNFYGKRLG